MPWTFAILGALAVGALAVACYGMEPVKWFHESRHARTGGGDDE